MSQLELLGSPEALAAWAHRALPLKNQLSIADAQAVEAAFEARLSEPGNPHGLASATANIDGAQCAESNGRVLTNGSSLAGWLQNDETKPIVRPEAG
jgi:hypothetical protein